MKRKKERKSTKAGWRFCGVNFGWKDLNDRFRISTSRHFIHAYSVKSIRRRHIYTHKDTNIETDRETVMRLCACAWAASFVRRQSLIINTPEYTTWPRHITPATHNNVDIRDALSVVSRSRVQLPAAGTVVYYVTTLGKLLTLLYLCHRAVIGKWWVGLTHLLTYLLHANVRARRISTDWLDSRWYDASTVKYSSFLNVLLVVTCCCYIDRPFHMSQRRIVPYSRL